MLARAFDPGALSAGLEPEELKALLADWQDPETAIAMLNWYRASPVVVPPMDAPCALPADFHDAPMPPLSIPTLVIWAMDDTALLPCNLDGLDEIIPNLTIYPVHGCSHFVTWGAPDAFNQAVDAFMAST
jgi:pimeloyl-ACP methyl ester carboxylesterase